MKSSFLRLLLIAFLVLPSLVKGQTSIIVYDGYTGIYYTSIQNDTCQVASILPGSPAEKAGILRKDQIIAIDDSLVAGMGLGRRDFKDLLLDQSGKAIDLLIKRKGTDSLLHFSFHREAYLHQIEAFEYEYMVDSLEQWDIHDIMSGSPDRRFINPLSSKSLIYSVEEGSPADQLGLLPGDQVVSLLDELDKDSRLHVSSGVLSSVVTDTFFTILRGDSLLHFDVKPLISDDLKGINSQFNKDFSHSCVWLKIKLLSRISENRSYLINFPEMEGTESASFYLVLPSGDTREKRAGILIPTEERDLIYKNWHAVSVPLFMDNVQTIYVRLNAESAVDKPLMHILAQDTLVRHDRIERMVLYSLLGMMMIISSFFLIIFFAVRKRQNIFFSLYILCFASFLFISEGYLGEYLWKESVFQSVFVSSAKPFSLSLLAVCFLLFGNSYLELRRKLPGWYKSILVLIGLIGIRVFIMLLGSIFHFELDGWFELVVLLLWVFSVVVAPLIILIVPTIFRIRSGFKPAWYFLIANAVLIPLTIITIDKSTFSLSAYTLNDPVLFRILEVSS